MSEPIIHVPNCQCQMCVGIAELSAINADAIEDALRNEPHDISKCRCQDCRALLAGLTMKLDVVDDILAS